MPTRTNNSSLFLPEHAKEEKLLLSYLASRFFTPTKLRGLNAEKLDQLVPLLVNVNTAIYTPIAPYNAASLEVLKKKREEIITPADIVLQARLKEDGFIVSYQQWEGAVRESHNALVEKFDELFPAFKNNLKDKKEKDFLVPSKKDDDLPFYLRKAIEESRLPLRQ